jgi:hypothetical protein
MYIFLRLVIILWKPIVKICLQLSRFALSPENLRYLSSGFYEGLFTKDSCPPSQVSVFPTICKKGNYPIVHNWMWIYF